MKVGLELEYWVTDDYGELTSSKKLAEESDFAEQEFVEPLIEIKTSPHSNVIELESEAIQKLSKLVRNAEEHDQKIIPLGTPLNSEEIEIIPSRRGKIQKKIIGENLEAAKRVAGTHIHFEKQDIEQQLNTLTALDPALALTNSSPYYQGQQVASSSRNQVYRFRCYENFPNHGQLWKYAESVKEWEERIEQNFGKFIEEGGKKEIIEGEIREHFNPNDALWTPVRLREKFPTIEWRAPDSGNIMDTFRMVREIKEIVEKGELEKPSFSKLQKLSGKAIKDGLEDREVRKYLEKCGFDTREYSPVSNQNSYNGKITLEKARELRLQHAYRPEELKQELEF